MARPRAGSAPMTTLLRVASFVTMLWLALAAASAATAADDLNAAIDHHARLALTADTQEARDAIEWLSGNGGPGAVAVLIQLMRWLPEQREAIDRGLAAMTGAAPRGDWFHWMVWQQGHPEIRPYDGFTGFTADFLAQIDERFRRFVRSDLPFDIRVEDIHWGGVTGDGIPTTDIPANL